MYKIETTFSFEAAHKLSLNYDSPCQNLHGHSYLCTITLASHVLNCNRMIMDFKILKQIIKTNIEDKFDHKYLNDVLEGNSTAEYMAKYICDEMNATLLGRGICAKCVKVELNETEKNKAIWEEDK